MRHATKQQLAQISIQLSLSALIFLAIWILLVRVGPDFVDQKAVQAWLAKREWLRFINPEIRKLLLDRWQSLTALLLTASLFFPLLKKPAAYLARRYFLKSSHLVLSWGPVDFGLPQPEFLYFFPPGFLHTCLPILKNDSVETIKINRIELKAAIFRRVADLGTEMLTGMGLSPLFFVEHKERDEETGLEWQKVAEDRWAIDTPFALWQEEEVELPGFDLNYDETDETVVTGMRGLVGLATLGVQFVITVLTDQRIINGTLSAPLRVLLSLEEGGDGGISALISKLEVKAEVEKELLRRVYEGARREDFRMRKAIAQRLNEIEAETKLQSIDQAIELQPGDPQSHYLRGRTLLEMGCNKEALLSLDKALQLGLDHPDLHLNRGAALRGLSRPEEALAEIDRVLAARPDDAAARGERGRVLIDLGRYEDALADFNHAIQLDQGLAEGYCGRGLALINLDAEEEALAAFNRAVALSPDCCLGYVGRALALSGHERDDEVLAGLKQALNLGYNDLNVLYRFESLMTEDAQAKFRQLLDSYDLLESYNLSGENSGSIN